MSSGKAKSVQKAMGMKGGSAVANHLTTLTLVLFATSIACGTIYNSDDYGLYDYIRWAYPQYHYYIELDAVACTGCSLDENKEQDLTGKCIPYMAHDGKVYALHSNGIYLNLTDEIGQEISIEKCIVDTLYRFTVRFLLQPILGSFEGAIFVLDNSISACNSDCWKQEVTINQSTLEEYHAKQDFLLVINNSEAMTVIKQFFELQEDSDGFTLIQKEPSQAPVFSSSGVNQLSVRAVINNGNAVDCELLNAKKEAMHEVNLRLKKAFKWLEACLPKNVKGAEIERLNGRIVDAKKTNKIYFKALISVSVVCGLFIIGLGVYVFKSVL